MIQSFALIFLRLIPHMLLVPAPHIQFYLLIHLSLGISFNLTPLFPCPLISLLLLIKFIIFTINFPSH